MFLRCMIREQGGCFVGTCLELSVSARGKSVWECKRELTRAMADYRDTLVELHETGDKVKLTPVKYYFVRKLLFNYYTYRGNSNRRRSFIQELVVPTEINMN